MTFSNYRIRFKSDYETQAIFYTPKVDKRITKEDAKWLRGYTKDVNLSFNEFEVNLNHVEFIERKQKVSEKEFKELQEFIEKDSN